MNARNHLETLLAQAQAAFDAMTPEQQKAHRDAQCESFVRGQAFEDEGTRMMKPDQSGPATDYADLIARLQARKGFGHFPGDATWFQFDQPDKDCADAAQALIKAADRIADLERERNNLVLSTGEHITARSEYLARAETAEARVQKLEEARAETIKHLDRARWQANRLGDDLAGVNWQAVVGLMNGDVERARRAAARSERGGLGSGQTNRLDRMGRRRAPG